ncbi:SusC/RagA family TonB-linked outer membrane protein [Adhaeribacter aquaticus]|uniref:SusC/RagA family TonB-linked outer membrane protein n=1 Tax=Adhaeribacter aquaticus TaxID=299567 RepID=UPI00047EF2C5|nr:SusC/RagA family TonB-linked outer membrane protein [Adhaeribacter aquaticus]
MKQKLLLILFLTCCASMSLWAQVQVKGKVSAAGNEGLPGVSVLIEGTTTGTTTDANGNYSLSAPGSGALVFSYIGFNTQRISINNRSLINVTLSQDNKQLEEVVVTALGITREKKALGYSVTEVGGENLTQARENNVSNALVGRVAGVNVSKPASGPAGSSRVIIRGAKSLQGNNQPLYVVDGIPINNNNNGQAGVWGGVDRGDGMASINPDDIESVTVLKGASAAALYGARAANGVINITTKKGSKRRGIGLEYNSNYVFERINNQTDLQTEFGGGNFAPSDPSNPASPQVPTKPTTIQQAYNWGGDSWGPRYDGSSAMHSDGLTRPYSYIGKENWNRFYGTGSSWTNTLALTGGGENQSFRFSVSDLRSTSVMPNSGFDRFNTSLSTAGKFGKRVMFDAKVLYSHENAKNRPYLSDSPNNAFQAIYRMPGHHNVLDYKGDPNKLGAIPAGTDPALLSFWGKAVGDEFQMANNNWLQNPYWAAHQVSIDDTRDRVIPSAQLRYNITDFLYVSGRAGMDWSTRRGQDIIPQGTGHTRNGQMNETEGRFREINLETMIGVDKTFGNFGINAFVGGNRMRQNSENLSLNGNGFNVPYQHFINNAVTRTFGYGQSNFGINSVFGSAEVDYKGYLYLTGTFRNDWFSVLNPERNSILYPSISTSFVFTDAFRELVPSWLSSGKVRASWAQVGNATVGPYQTQVFYSLLGATHVGQPMASFSSAQGNNGTIPNSLLLPATSTELETGFDLRLFDNKLGVEFTYYNQRTTDDILSATISRGSGFGSTLLNVGELTNKGIELGLNATPVRGAFTWDVYLNFARNRNRVEKLVEGNSEMIVEEPRTRTTFVKHIVGQPFGVITGWVQKRSPDGQPVYEANGSPVQSDKMQIIGNGVPDFTGGLTNTLSYKNFELGFLVDLKMGGDIYSGTNLRLTQWGLTKQSLQGREGEAPLTVKGVIQKSVDTNGSPVYEPFEKTLTPLEARNYWNNLGERVQDHWVYDASYAKLRQVTFGYNLPSSLVSKTPFQSLGISFVGRNLAILWKNVPNIDPESTYSSGNGQGLDFFGMPITRTFGFNLRASF